MSRLQPSISGGYIPLTAFYTLSGMTTPISSKSVFATPTATKSFRMIPTAVIAAPHSFIKSSSRIASASSMPSSSIAGSPPPLITLPPPLHNQVTTDNNKHVAWLAPLLGVLGAMGVAIIAIIFFIRRRRYKAPSSPRAAVIHDDPSSPSRHNRPLTANKYASWASCSTINTSAAAHMLENEKKAIHMLQPPPAYTTTTITSKREKRLTADTLVDEHSFSMLKSQYSPQLAFSPSLVPGEFQRQQLDLPSLPTNNQQQISPSNTLIDNAGVLSDEKKENYCAYGSQQRIKIEMYDPQVNLHGTDDDGEETPCNYPNNQEEKVNVCEGQKHTAADTTKTAHHVINMNNANKQ